MKTFFIDKPSSLGGTNFHVSGSFARGSQHRGGVTLRAANLVLFAFYVKKFDRPLKLTVSAATGGEERSVQLGVVGQMVKGEKVLEDATMDFGWNKVLQRDVFTDQVFTINVPEKFRERGESIFILLYRCNKTGILKIKNVKLEFLKRAEESKEDVDKKSQQKP